MIKDLASIVSANLQYEELTDQILLFVHSILNVIGIEAVGLVSQVVNTCASQLPYERCSSILKILILAVEKYHIDSIQLLSIALGSIFTKAIQTPLPQSNISD